VHSAGFVVGDLSPKNVMLRRDGLVSLLDCDSYQFRHDGRDVMCESATPDYAAPELMTVPGSPHSTATDDFSLAVMLCELMMCGNHPFMGTPKGVDIEENTPSESIRLGACRIVRPTDVTVPADAIDVGVLPVRVRTLAMRAFGSGHSRPDERPTAEMWAAALRTVRDGITTCQVDTRHRFHNSAPECPWCARLRRGLDDPFSTDDFITLPAGAPSAGPDATDVTDGFPRPRRDEWSDPYPAASGHGPAIPPTPRGTTSGPPFGGPPFGGPPFGGPPFGGSADPWVPPPHQPSPPSRTPAGRLVPLLVGLSIVLLVIFVAAAVVAMS
jgi:serine/threonine protein kinase